jgi:hypothetical protein
MLSLVLNSYNTQVFSELNTLLQMAGVSFVTWRFEPTGMEEHEISLVPAGLLHVLVF